jgi:hypothetical protein
MKRVLRRTAASVGGDIKGEWRKLDNEELQHLYFQIYFQ